MTKPCAFALAASLVLGLAAGDARAAQAAKPPADWRTMTDLPFVDFSGVSAKQKKQVLDILRAEGCTCGCDMKLAECRVKDPQCSTSRPLAAAVIKAVLAGKSVAEIHKSFAERASQPMPVLEPAVKIAVAGAPFKGPLDARLTIVEFSDYQ
ncbi:MAG: hypothetical protein HYX25_06695 [Candidatus Solibacter usitatus]|nr:hypothetical protein [Candidatus Solibacter usitatus]